MTHQEYQTLRTRVDEYYRNRKTPVTNEEISALEVYEWEHFPPESYFLYINEVGGIATTCTGDKLGDVTWGRQYRDNFGGVRVPIHVHGTNGVHYHGTYYKSAGDYARIKRSKR